MSEYRTISVSKSNQAAHLPGMIQLYTVATGEKRDVSWLAGRLEISRKESEEVRVHVCYRYEAVVGFYFIRYNSNLRKNKAQIDELFVAGDYSEGGVGDLCVGEAVSIIGSKTSHFNGAGPIHVELKMNVPKYTKSMSPTDKKDRRFKGSFLKRNGFTEKRPPSKATGISEYERILPNV